MNGYVLSVTSAAVGAGAILMLCPENPRIKKYLNFLVSLCLLCTLLLPLRDAIGKIPELLESLPVDGAEYIETDVSGAEYLISALNDELSLAAERDIYAKFGAQATVTCGIEYTEKENEARLYEMTVTLRDGKKWLEADIEKYLGTLYGCDIKIEEVKKSSDRGN